MIRREFIAVIGVAALSRAAMGQQVAPQAVRIGYLSPNPRVGFTAYDAFLDELGNLGYRDGENLVIDFRALGDDAGKLRAAAAAMAHANPDLLVADGPEAALKAAVDATSVVPIVMLAVNFDPVARNYVSGLSRPGANVTGVVFRQPDLVEKQLQLLRDAVPGATRLGILWDAISVDQLGAAKKAAQLFAFTTTSLKLENPPYDFGAAFHSLSMSSSQMVLVLSSPYFNRQRAQIAELAVRHRLPSMFTFQSYVEAGGLMFYGADNEILHRRAAHIVAKILRGARPSDLPVEQPTELKLAINLKTAKALGITMPQTVIARADEVIE
jgi:putative tryptophan/tyrosine transport system substrate-binding protein